MKARYQISTAVSKDLAMRIEKIRKQGWTIPKIIIAGVIVAERLITKEGSQA